MAEMIPESFRGENSGERRIFGILRDGLPDDHLAYHAPVLETRGRIREPDFVVVAPDLGVIALEIKAWTIGQLLKADTGEVVVELGDSPKTCKHPLQQARDYMWALKDGFERHRCLVQNSGPHAGQLAFPLGYGVVLTRISRTQLERHLGPPAEQIFPVDHTICQDDLKRLEDANLPPGELRRHLRTMRNVRFSFDPLGDRELQTLRGVLRPSIVVHAPASHKSLKETETVSSDVLEVLDVRQEQLAESIGRGHRVVLGVAGSGKTLILLARARRLAAEDPRRKILVLTFNIVLAAALRARLADDPNAHAIEISHYHAWPGASRRRRTVSRYDAILIDEANDFEPAWFRRVVEALIDPEDGDLLIVGDGAQAIYRRGRFTWASVGVKARGRTMSARFNLRRNYRNTRPILELAYGVVTSEPVRDVADAAFAPVHPEEALRDGEAPVLALCESREDEVARVVVWVRELVEGRHGKPLEERQIALLYPYKERHIGLLRDRLSACCANEPYFVTESRDNKRAYSDEYPGVRISTIHSAKGLEFPAAAVIFADQLPRAGLEDVTEAEQRHLLYVGMTRACDHLLVTGSPRRSDCFFKHLCRTSFGIP